MNSKIKRTETLVAIDVTLTTKPSGKKKKKKKKGKN